MSIWIQSRKMGNRKTLFVHVDKPLTLPPPLRQTWFFWKPLPLSVNMVYGWPLINFKNQVSFWEHHYRSSKFAKLWAFQNTPISWNLCKPFIENRGGQLFQISCNHDIVISHFHIYYNFTKNCLDFVDGKRNTYLLLAYSYFHWANFYKIHKN